MTPNRRNGEHSNCHRIERRKPLLRSFSMENRSEKRNSEDSKAAPREVSLKFLYTVCARRGV